MSVRDSCTIIDLCGLQRIFDQSWMEKANQNHCSKCADCWTTSSRRRCQRPRQAGLGGSQGRITDVDVARLDVNELAEFVQVRRRFVRNHIPDEFVESIDCCDLLCSLHMQKVRSAHTLLWSWDGRILHPSSHKTILHQMNWKESSVESRCVRLLIHVGRTWR